MGFMNWLMKGAGFETEEVYDNSIEIQKMKEEKQLSIVLTEKDMEVIRLLRQTDYGKVLVTVKNGEPVHAEIQKSIPLK